jgi:hypothetical protein
MTGFSLQEFIISGLYVFETRKILKLSAMFRKKRTRQVMRHLICINILIIILDVSLLALEYANYFMIQGIYKAAVYGIKLRLEFSILNQLVDIAKGHKDDFGSNLHSVYCQVETSLESGGSRGIPVFTTAAMNGSTASPPNASGVVNSTRSNSTKDKDSANFLDNTDSVLEAPPTIRLGWRSDSSSSKAEFAGMGY